MRVVVISRDNTDYFRAVESFTRDFSRQTGHVLEVMSPDSKDGISFCTTYGVLEYPTIVALSDDGQMQNRWAGPNLPTISEVSFYV